MPVAHTNADDIPSRRRRLFRMGVIHSNDHTSLLFVWCLFILCIVLVTGCASNEYVTVRKVPRNPLTTSLNLLSRTGPKLTPRTTQLLRRFDLPGQDKFSVEALEKLQAEIRIEPTPDKMHACAEMAYVGGKRAETAGRKAEALDLYGTAVAHAYWYLFDPLHDELRNPYDPLFRPSPPPSAGPAAHSRCIAAMRAAGSVAR